VRAAPCASARKRLGRAGLLAAPSPSRNGAPKSANTLEEGEHVMTWTSDRAGVVLYTVLGMLIVLSSIYIPA